MLPAIALASLAGIAAAVYVANRRMHAAMARKRYGAAIAWSHVCRRVPGLVRKARTAAAIAHVRRHEYELADRVLRPRTDDTPMEDYLRATLRAMQGREKEAYDHLADCLALSPAYLAEARINPHLSPILAKATDAALARRRDIIDGYA